MASELPRLLLVLAGVLCWVLVFRVLFAAREGIVWTLQAALFGVLVFFIARGLFLSMHQTPQQANLAGIAGGIVAVAATPKRSRHIRSSVRKRVIARDLKGERYDSRKHHIDHIWPYARGGSNAADNLRVISKAENLRKGAKKPRLRDWF